MAANILSVERRWRGGRHVASDRFPFGGGRRGKRASRQEVPNRADNTVRRTDDSDTCFFTWGGLPPLSAPPHHHNVMGCHICR